MKKTHILGSFLFAFFAIGNSVQAQIYNPFAEAKANAFVDSLMSKMTLDEKIGQLNLPSVGFDVTGPVLSKDVEAKIARGEVGGVFNTFTPVAVRKLQERAIKETRLGIPLLLGYDVIHGHRTIFPIALGLSATWNLGLIEKSASVAAKEATADGLNWTFSPMVDIARDPRWGRVSEGAGEDPYLGSRISEAMVWGYQGKKIENLSKQNDKLMACVKHFALYGGAEAGRDYNTVDMSLYKMYNDYLPPYEAAINAGVATVMTSFNDINGMPATCNEDLIQGILRKEWGFEGMVVTDYTAINELENHGMGSGKTIAARSIKAGAEMDMVGELYLLHLKNIANNDPEYLKYIDRACKNILLSKYRLGLFSDPYRGLDEKNQSVMLSEEHLQSAQKAAEESFVLLKNENQVLPLKPTSKIAFIGPHIKRKRDLIGSWSGAGDWKKAVSIWDALTSTGSTVKAENIKYAEGCNLLEDLELIAKLNPHDGQIEAPKDSKKLLKEAMAVAKKSEVIVVAVGETFGMSGEAACRSNIHLPAHQVEMIKSLHTLGKPIVLVLMNGRPLVLTDVLPYCSAILECWFPGTQAGPAIVNTLYGKNNPSGKITMTFPQNEGQIPIYYNSRTTGRPFDNNQKYTSKYLDVSNEPLFPFGFGLSYSNFEYSNLTAETKGTSVVLTAEIKNISQIDGQEVVQFYASDLEATYTRPKKQLVGFEKVTLKAGESKKVTVNVEQGQLGYYDQKGEWFFEPGMFRFSVGGSSQTTLNKELKVLKTFKPHVTPEF